MRHNLRMHHQQKQVSKPGNPILGSLPTTVPPLPLSSEESRANAKKVITELLTVQGTLRSGVNTEVLMKSYKDGKGFKLSDFLKNETGASKQFWKKAVDKNGDGQLEVSELVNINQYMNTIISLPPKVKDGLTDVALISKSAWFDAAEFVADGVDKVREAAPSEPGKRLSWVKKQVAGTDATKGQLVDNATLVKYAKEITENAGKATLYDFSTSFDANKDMYVLNDFMDDDFLLTLLFWRIHAEQMTTNQQKATVEESAKIKAYQETPLYKFIDEKEMWKGKAPDLTDEPAPSPPEEPKPDEDVNEPEPPPPPVLGSAEIDAFVYDITEKSRTTEGAEDSIKSKEYAEIFTNPSYVDSNGVLRLELLQKLQDKLSTNWGQSKKQFASFVDRLKNKKYHTKDMKYVERMGSIVENTDLMAQLNKMRTELNI